MRVLVTGAAGRLGGYVLEALRQAEFDVRATDGRFARGLGSSFELADLLDEYACYRLVEGCEAVVHLGNHPNLHRGISRQRVYRENVAMTSNVLCAATDLGAKKIIYASSIQAICGDRLVREIERPSVLPYLPLDGDLPRQPGNEYALSKVAGEELLEHLCRKDAKLSATAVRFPWLADPDWVQWRPPKVRRHPWGADHAHADEGFLYLLFSDAGRLVPAILQHQGPGYHQMLPAASGSSVHQPVADLVKRFYPNVPLKTPGRPLTSLVDTSAITAAVGWSPTAHEVEPEGASTVTTV